MKRLLRNLTIISLISTTVPSMGSEKASANREQANRVRIYIDPQTNDVEIYTNLATRKLDINDPAKNLKLAFYKKHKKPSDK